MINIRERILQFIDNNILYLRPRIQSGNTGQYRSVRVEH